MEHLSPIDQLKLVSVSGLYLPFPLVQSSDASADRRSAVSLSPVLLRILFLYANDTTMHAGISLRTSPCSDRQFLDAQEHLPALIPPCNAPIRTPQTAAPEPGR